MRRFAATSATVAVATGFKYFWQWKNSAHSLLNSWPQKLPF